MHGEAPQPVARNGAQAVKRPCQLSRNRCGRIGIIAQVRRQQHRVAVAGGARHAPECRFERVHDIARRQDVAARLAAPASCHDGSDTGTAIKRPRREQRGAIGSADRCRQQFGIGDAGIDRFVCSMRDAALLGRDRFEDIRLVPVAQGHWRQTHQAAIARAHRVAAACVSIAGLLEALQGLPGGDPDIEAGACARIGAFIHPRDEPLRTIAGIEGLMRKETVSERQRHGRVIRPLACFEIKRSAAHHVGQPRIAVARPELERGAYRIANRQPDQRADPTIADSLRIASRVLARRFGLRIDIVHLLVGFDRAGPNPSHFAHRVGDLPAQFDQQPRSDRAGPAQPAHAVNYHVEPCPQPVEQPCPDDGPMRFERRIGHVAIADRQMDPVDMAIAHSRAQVRDLEQRQLALLDQGHHYRSVPVFDDIEIETKIAVPAAGQAERLDLPRTKGDPEQAVALGGADLGDLQGMGQAGTHERGGSSCTKEEPVRILIGCSQIAEDVTPAILERRIVERQRAAVARTIAPFVIKLRNDPRKLGRRASGVLREHQFGFAILLGRLPPTQLLGRFQRRGIATHQIEVDLLQHQLAKFVAEGIAVQHFGKHIDQRLRH